MVGNNVTVVTNLEDEHVVSGVAEAFYRVVYRVVYKAVYRQLHVL
jgi:hypothetical protein